MVRLPAENGLLESLNPELFTSFVYSEDIGKKKTSAFNPRVFSPSEKPMQVRKRYLQIQVTSSTASTASIYDSWFSQVMFPEPIQGLW